MPNRGKPDLNARYYILRSKGLQLFVIDDRTLLFGSKSGPRDEGSLMPYCAQMLRRAESGPLALAIAEAAKKHTLVAGFNAKALPQPLGPGFERFAIVLSAKAAFLTLDLGDELLANLTIEAVEPADGKKIEDGLRGLATWAKEFLLALQFGSKPQAKPDANTMLVELAEKALGKLTIEERNGTVRASTSAKADALFTIAIQVALEKVHVAHETRGQHQHAQADGPGGTQLPRCQRATPVSRGRQTQLARGDLALHRTE